jgi:hypothetical protein
VFDRLPLAGGPLDRLLALIEAATDVQLVVLEDLRLDAELVLVPYKWVSGLAPRWDEDLDCIR